EVPTVGSAEIHHADEPKVWAADQFAPRNFEPPLLVRRWNEQRRISFTDAGLPRRCLRQSCLNGSGQRFRYHGSMTELDQCQFRIVSLGMLTRKIAEQEIERDAPDNADNAEDPEDMPPVCFRMNRYLVGAVRFIEERQDNERSDPAGESARHPHGPL